MLHLNVCIKDNITHCTTGETDETSDKCQEFSWKEIPRDEITIEAVLGEGEFGVVQKATWRSQEYDQETAVAIKSVKSM